MKDCESVVSSPTSGNARKKQNMLLLQAAITSDDENKWYESKKLPPDIASCFASRHLETQTHQIYVWGLHD